MDNNKMIGEYMKYLLIRCMDPYEDYPDERSLNFIEFKKNLLKEKANNGSIK